MPSGAAKAPSIFNCLIRTHHITSRKKLHRVRRAADQLRVDWLLVRTGGSPGIMFAEARDEAALSAWVAAVHALRYKDFRCVAKPAPSTSSSTSSSPSSPLSSTASGCTAGFQEFQSVADFSRELEKRGIDGWFRTAMGYSPPIG